MREFARGAKSGWLRAPLQRARQRLRANAGFALIEVIVSAGLLMVVAGGVLAGIDGPGQVSARNEARSQASALAQRDQERLRSMPVSQLIGYSNTSNVSVNNAGSPAITYTVASSAVWLRDNVDVDSCNTAAGDTSGDYLKITARVTSPNSAAPPVQVDSLLTPPPGTFAADTKGILALQIRNQADQPLVGQSVSISGPQSMTVTTNAAGCAVFGLVTKGNYNMTFTRPGWVDPAGANAVSIPTSVTPGGTTVEHHSYAQAGTISVKVDTQVGSAVSNSPAKAVTIGNQKIPTGTVTFPATVPGQYQFSLQVFPFTTSYNVWAGGCTSGNPLIYVKPGITALATAGGTTSVTVRAPAINLTVTRGGALYASSNVRIKSTDPDCPEAYVTTTSTSGKLANPGFPYGNYLVCADDGTSFDSQSVVNTNPAGTAVAVDIPKGSKKNPVPPDHVGTCT
jgi:type II secretory pathway pseudopilin PulG